MSDTGPTAPASGDGDGQQQSTEQSEERKLTQAEVDEQIKARVAKERAKFGDVNELKRKASEFDKLEQAKKSEAEQLTERASKAEERATSAELASMRLEVALDKAPEGMPMTQVRKLAKRLTGTSREDLEVDADELFADFAPAKAADGDDDSGQQSKPGDQRPREQTRTVPLPGGDKIQLDEETNPRELAKNIRL